MFADKIRRTRLAFARSTEGELTALATIAADPYHPANYKTKMSEPYRAALAEKHAAAVTEARKLRDEARLAMHAREPRVLHRKAGVKSPQRAADIKALVLGSPRSDIPAIIEQLAESNDPAGAHGVRLALTDASINLDEKTIGAYHRTLDRIGSAGFELMLAEFVGAQWELFTLESRGPENDNKAILERPAETLTAARAARVVPYSHGDVSIDEPELARLCALADVPIDRPEMGAAA